MGLLGHPHRSIVHMRGRTWAEEGWFLQWPELVWTKAQATRGGSHRVRRASVQGGGKQHGRPAICWGTGQTNKHITDRGDQLSLYQRRELQIWTKTLEKTIITPVIQVKFVGIDVNIWFSIYCLEIAIEINIDVNVGVCMNSPNAQILFLTTINY